MVGGPKWTKIDLFRPKWTKMDQFGPFWSRECENPVRNNQDAFDHDKGQKSAISGRRLHWRLSTGFFAFSPGSLCNLVRRAP